MCSQAAEQFDELCRM